MRVDAELAAHMGVAGLFFPLEGPAAQGLRRFTSSRVPGLHVSQVENRQGHVETHVVALLKIPADALVASFFMGLLCPLAYRVASVTPSQNPLKECFCFG